MFPNNATPNQPLLLRAQETSQKTLSALLGNNSQDLPSDTHHGPAGTSH